MTTVPLIRRERPVNRDSERRLPDSHIVIVGVVAFALAALLLALAGSFSVPGVAVAGFFIHLVGTYIYSRLREGRRWAKDRVATILTFGAFCVAMVPLVSLLWEVTYRGFSRLSGSLAVALVVLAVAVAILAAIRWAVKNLDNRLHHNGLTDGQRKARVAGAALVLSVVGIALLVLVSNAVYAGLASVLGTERVNFWYTDMAGVIGGMNTGGIGHAIVGTLMVTLGATLISVPVGIFTAIYLVEYAQTGWRKSLGRGITFLVDVMTGIPSIVAGLFGLALFVTISGNPGIAMGIMGSVALSVLMIPTVVRSSEEMLCLVPLELREAAYALGVPRWLTILKVVLRTSVAGLTTGVTLAIARIIGETAPLLLTVRSLPIFNSSLFNGRVETLPTFINGQYRAGNAVCNSPSLTNPITKLTYECSTSINFDRAWAAALTLIIIVMALNIVSRMVSYYFAPKISR